MDTMREMCEAYFSDIEDQRCQCDIAHKLMDVLIITMCAVLCGLDKLQDIVTYGKEKRQWLNECFGISTTPSKSTLSRILNMVDGDKMVTCTIGVMQECLGLRGDIIALDGKTICSTGKNPLRETMHILTAYLTENGVILGQAAVDEKTNEIPVARDLLEGLDIAGKIITADSLHCQQKTVAAIVEDGQGDYVIGLKGNQEIMHEEIKLYMDDCIADKQSTIETAETIEKNKDRLEHRICYKAPSIDWFEDKDKWAGLRTAFAVRRIVTTAKGTTDETSYYISSLDVSAASLLEIVREHWKIESLHWQLDVVFSEDDCRVLSANGQKTLNIFRKFALSLHKNFIFQLKKKTKPSLRQNMFKALLSNSFLQDLFAAFV
jgi:predicted transposase YbfD/YdcC